MANFAKIVNDKVVKVVSVSNDILIDENNIEQPQKGINFLNNLFNSNDEWVQTSYNNNFRKIFAGIDYTYDRIRDVFIPWKPFNSWIFNEITWEWEAPKPKPEILLDYPKDRNGNILHNVGINENFKIIETLPEGKKYFAHHYWDESKIDWVKVEGLHHPWTEEKQQLFLTVNNL